MSFFIKEVPAAGSLCSVLIKNNFDVKKIEESLERDSSCINNEVTYNEPPLCDVLRNKNCSSVIIRLLLKYGANVNVSCFVSSVTPLIAALEASKDEEVIRLLLENGANINVFMSQQTPLCIALHYGASKGVVQLLLDAGCPLNACKGHDSVLFCATDNTRTGLKEDVLHLLIERGANVNAVNRNGQSVLCFALRLHTKVHDIGLLLSAGASFNACTQHLSAMLCVTEQNGLLKADVVKLLLDEGAHADDLDGPGLTPLQRALVSCDYEIGAISLLLDCHPGEEVYNVVSNLRRNLLHLAVMNVKCKPSVVELLIKRGFLVNARDRDGATTLHIAAMNQVKASVIKILLKNGAVVNTKDRYLKTPFHLAVEFWLNTDIIKVMLHAGAIVTYNNGHSFLESALDRICAQQRMGYSEKNALNCSLLVMKYYFLENPRFDFQSLVRSHKEYKAFSQFAEDCVLELQKMESVIVGHNLALLDFLRNSRPLRETANSTREDKNYDFDQLLEKIADYEFPLFFDIISVKVGRPAMVAKLREVHVYAMKCIPNRACIGEEIFLNYYCMSEMAQYLINEDLLRLIVTFNYTSDHTCASGQASEEKIRGNKRNSEESAQCLKHLKLTPEFL